MATNSGSMDMETLGLDLDSLESHPRFFSWLGGSRRIISEIYTARDDFLYALSASGKGEENRYETPVPPVRNAYATWLNTNKELAHIMPEDGEIPPEFEDAFKRRRIYASAITNLAQESAKVSTGPGMLINGTAVMTYTLDIWVGPELLRIVHRHRKEGVEEKVDELQKNGQKLTFSYSITYEKNRYFASQQILQEKEGYNPKIQIFGTSGVPNGIGGSRSLTYNLYDLMQPTLHSLLKSPEHIEEARERTDHALKEFLELREKSKEKFRILLEDPDVRKQILNEFRPRKLSDLISGHPLSIELRKKASQDSNIAENLKRLEEDFAYLVPGINACTGLHTYDIALTPLLGPADEKALALDIFLYGLGYPRMPLFESRRTLVPNSMMKSISFFAPNTYMEINPEATFEFESSRLKDRSPRVV